MPVRWSQRASRKTPAVGRAIHVVGGEPRARRAAPRVDDLGGAEHAPFAEHQPGRGVRVDREVRRVDALAAEAPRIASPNPSAPTRPMNATS